MARFYVFGLFLLFRKLHQSALKKELSRKLMVSYLLFCTGQ